MTYGNRLRAAMRAVGMSNADIGKLCDVSRTTVGRWLEMKEAPRPAQHAACIADATGADLRRLITGNGKRRNVPK